MADHRALAAIRRIESALARVDAAALRPEPSSGVDREELERLRSAHDRLRQRVGGAIDRIDELLRAGQAG